VYDRVTRDQGGAEQATGDSDGIVPGRDDRDHATRPKGHQIDRFIVSGQGLAAMRRAGFSVLPERADPGRDRLGGPTDRFAHLDRHDRGKFAGRLLDRGGGGVQSRGPARGRRRGPAGGCGRSCADGRRNVVGRAEPHPCHRLAVGRVEDGQMVSGVTWLPGSVNKLSYVMHVRRLPHTKVIKHARSRGISAGSAHWNYS
jgi:hypothetical protein